MKEPALYELLAAPPAAQRRRFSLIASMKKAATLLIAGVGFVVGTSVAPAQKIALVVGNNAYQYASQLNSPIADAVDVSRILDSSGFKTLKLTDANQSQMANAINTFGIASRSADICLFYFSGHGIELNGANYLVPANGRLRDYSDLETQMIPLNSLLNALRQTGVRRKIVILDCCRSNPFKISHRRARCGSR